MSFNPFDKPIGGQLTVADLRKLIQRQVAEGYYVEYDRDLQSEEKISQSVASFANTYGGWYIIGIESEQHTAKAINGISLETYPDPLAIIHNGVKYLLDPVPIYFPQIIAISDNQAVIVIYVPDGQETPYISKDGRIYRRNYENSDPVPEINRYTIDRLVDQGRSIGKQFAEFCGDENNQQPNAGDQGWLKLFLSPYPSGSVFKDNMLTKESIDKLLQLSQRQIEVPFGDSMIQINGNLPFNFGRPTHQSIILREVDPVNLDVNSMTAEFFTNGQAKLFVPLNYLPSLHNWEFEQLGSEAVKTTLQQMIAAERNTKPVYMRFFDIGQLWLTLACLLCYYREWLGENELLAELQFAVTIKEVWRSVPFFDSDEWAKYVNEYGLPVMGEQTIKIPREIERGGGMRINLSNEWPLWLEVCYFLSLAFGLPPELYSNSLLKAVEQSVKPENSWMDKLKT